MAGGRASKKTKAKAATSDQRAKRAREELEEDQLLANEADGSAQHDDGNRQREDGDGENDEEDDEEEEESSSEDDESSSELDGEDDLMRELRTIMRGSDHQEKKARKWLTAAKKMPSDELAENRKLARGQKWMNLYKPVSGQLLRMKVSQAQRVIVGIEEAVTAENVAKLIATDRLFLDEERVQDMLVRITGGARHEVSIDDLARALEQYAPRMIDPAFQYDRPNPGVHDRASNTRSQRTFKILKYRSAFTDCYRPGVPRLGLKYPPFPGPDASEKQRKAILADRAAAVEGLVDIFDSIVYRAHKKHILAATRSELTQENGLVPYFLNVIDLVESSFYMQRPTSSESDSQKLQDHLVELPCSILSKCLQDLIDSGVTLKRQLLDVRNFVLDEVDSTVMSGNISSTDSGARPDFFRVMNGIDADKKASTSSQKRKQTGSKQLGRQNNLVQKYTSMLERKGNSGPDTDATLPQMLHYVKQTRTRWGVTLARNPETVGEFSGVIHWMTYGDDRWTAQAICPVLALNKRKSALRFVNYLFNALDNGF